MNKSFYIAGFCIIACVVALLIIEKIIANYGSTPETDPNYFFRQEVHNFYAGPTQTFASAFSSSPIETNGLTYSFYIQAELPETKITSTNQAEKKFSEIFIEYQKLLNSTHYIRPFLAEFPVPAHCLIFSAKFKDVGGNYLPPPNLNSVCSYFSGYLEFSMYIPSYKWKVHYLIRKSLDNSAFLKPYLNPSVKRTYPNKEIKIPLYKYDPRDPPYWKSMAVFMSDFAAKQNLFPLRLIPVGEKNYDWTPFGFAVWGKRELSFEDARLMAATCARDFFNFIQQDKECVAYMKSRGEKDEFHDSATIPEPRHFAFRISLWDEGINRQPSPFIAEIRYDKGVFEYFTSDEGQRLVLVHEESFDEAMQFLRQ